MPLTQAHPAAAIPFRRLGIPLSALIVGSMAPDFSKFATMSPMNNFGHTLGGVFWFCIPAGLFVLLFFHKLLKEPLLSLLPESHQQRLANHVKFSFLPLRQSAMVICGLIIGAITHLFWDSFTHYNGYFVLKYPFLISPVFSSGSLPIRIYSLLQHGSSIFGLTVLTVWYHSWYRRSVPTSSPALQLPLSQKTKSTLWLVFIAGACCPALIYGLLRARHYLKLPVIAFKVFAARSFIAATFIFCIELIIFSVIWHYRVRSRKMKDDSDVTNLSSKHVQSAR